LLSRIMISGGATIIGMTRSTAPSLVESPRLTLRDLKRLAPVAVSGCVASGLASSAYYSLIPAYAEMQGISHESVSAYIATAIFGGLAFQVPVGKLSDRFDRRLVAAGVATGLCTTALVLAVVQLPQAMIFIGTFVLGGFLTTIYPVCVAHANDRVSSSRIVAVSGQLILTNGIASFLGPIIGTAVMGVAGIEGVFAYMAVVAAIFAAVAIWRTVRVEGSVPKERPFVVLDSRMSQPIAHVVEEED
jgi:MFS family permease